MLLSVQMISKKLQINLRSSQKIHINIVKNKSDLYLLKEHI